MRIVTSSCRGRATRVPSTSGEDGVWRVRPNAPEPCFNGVRMIAPARNSHLIRSQIIPLALRVLGSLHTQAVKSIEQRAKQCDQTADSLSIPNVSYGTAIDLHKVGVGTLKGGRFDWETMAWT